MYHGSHQRIISFAYLTLNCFNAELADQLVYFTLAALLTCTSTRPTLATNTICADRMYMYPPK